MSVLPKVRSGRFSTWRTGSMNRRIFAAAVTVGSLNLVAKLVTTGKELVVAGRFGTGDALDAFFIAWLLPSVAINVIGGAFGPAFLPTYIDVRERRGQAAAGAGRRGPHLRLDGAAQRARAVRGGRRGARDHAAAHRGRPRRGGSPPERAPARVRHRRRRGARDAL